MNDYQALITFTRAQLAATAPPTGLSYRDLHDYFKEKYDSPGNKTKADVTVMFNRVFTLTGLNSSPTHVSTLDQTSNAELRARAATLLAMSLIRDLGPVELAQQNARLKRLPESTVLAELRATLSRGDLKPSRRHAQLELKNFESAGTRKLLWVHEVEDAYERAHALLLKCGQVFLVGHDPCKGAVETAFNDYFGDPTAVVTPAQLKFAAGQAPSLPGAAPTRLDVVRAVLRSVWRQLVNQDVRIYFGGRLIDAGTNAYVSGDVNPTKIHVGGTFFTKQREGLDTPAGTLIHECTHTFAGTRDHAYGVNDCQALVTSSPNKALSNADSYEYFVEAAFG